MVIIRLPSMLGNIACDLCKKEKKKYLIEMVACAWDGYINHTNNAGKLVAPYMFFYTRKNVKNAKNVLYVTNKFLQDRYPTKGNSISCSDVVLPIQNQQTLTKRLEKIDKYDENQTLELCTVANVGLKYKGQEYVIRALSKIINSKNKNRYKYKYYLVGNGNCTRIKKIIAKYKLEDNVIILGSLPHDKVFEVLDNIDIYIQPSLVEGLPRALLEAMSRACPAIGSNAGGITELLDSKCIFPKKKVDKLVNILINLDKERLINMAKYSFYKAEKYEVKQLEIKRDNFYNL